MTKGVKVDADARGHQEPSAPDLANSVLEASAEVWILSRPH
jgi:hypothetical protein